MGAGVVKRPIRNRPSGHAFEIEIEEFWCARICRLPPGKTIEVWLGPDWTLSVMERPNRVRVGGSFYNREVTLRDFRDDCFEALEG